jgi:hypothetical protein
MRVDQTPRYIKALFPFWLENKLCFAHDAICLAIVLSQWVHIDLCLHECSVFASAPKHPVFSKVLFVVFNQNGVDLLFSDF